MVHLCCGGVDIQRQLLGTVTLIFVLLTARYQHCPQLPPLRCQDVVLLQTSTGGSFYICGSLKNLSISLLKIN